MARRAQAGTLASFGASTLLLAVGGVAFVPAVIHATGQQTWGAVAFGQAAGILGAVFIGYGWMVIGPTAIGRLDQGEAVKEYRVSVVARLGLTVPVSITGVAAVYLLRPAQPDVAALSFVTTAITGLSAYWWFVGRRQPNGFLAGEVVARTTGTGLAVAALLLDRGIYAALVLQGLGMVIGVFVASRLINHGRGGDRVTLSDCLGALRRQRSGLLTGIGQSLYLSLPVVLVGAFAATALPLYALVDKLLKQVMSGIAPIISVAQGWVPAGGSGEDMVPRVKRALLLGLLGAALLAIGFMLLGQIVVHLFSAGTQSLSWTELVLAGLLFGTVLLERLTGRVALASLGQTAALARATLGGAVCGLVALVPSVATVGVPGAIGAVLLGLVVMVACQLGFVVKAVRQL